MSKQQCYPEEFKIEAIRQVTERQPNAQSDDAVPYMVAAILDDTLPGLISLLNMPADPP